MDWKPLQLAEEEEKVFQEAFRSSPFFQEFVERYGEEPNLEGDYDYRRWWKDSGLEATRSPHDGTLHGPSKASTGEWLKSPDHPTAWKQEFMENFGFDPDDNFDPVAQ